MDIAKIVKFFSENYDKGIVGGLSVWVAKKIYNFAAPRYKKLKEFSHSVDRILQLQLDVDLIEEENYILRETFKGIVKTAVYPMYMMDKQNNLVLVNDPWLKLTGFNNPEDAYATGYFKAVHKSDLERMHEIANERKGSGSPASGSIKFENLIIGDVSDCLYRTEVIKNSKGEIINYVGSLKIISITPKNK